MQSKRHNKPADDSKAYADQALSALFKQAKAQFGDAVKSFWFYNGDLCPGGLARPVSAVKVKGKDTLSLNAFIYRPRDVLIGYFLSEVCANFIFKEAEKNPYKQTPLHADIEANLIAAYQKYLMSLDA